MNVKENFILDYLKEKKRFVLSSELTEKLIEKYPSISKTYARKIISDMNKKRIINASNPIIFSNNSYAYSYKKRVTYKNLENLIKEEKKKLYRAICLLKRQNGIATYNELAKVTGGITSKTGSNVEIEKIIEELKYLKICTKTKYKEITFLTYNNITENELEDKILDLKQENKIIIHILNWLKDINIINTKDAFTFKGEKNNFVGIENGNIIWDAFFFTNTTGINYYYGDDDTKKTIGILDLLDKSEYDWIDIEGLKDRIDIFTNSTKGEKRKIFPIICANNITNSARTLIEKYNYMFINIRKILGNNYENIISKYMEIENKSEIDIDEIEEICDLIGSNANYGNMKGNLFEYMMGEVFRKVYNENGTNIDHSIKIGDREIDYRIETPTENIFIELKAYKEETEIKLGKKDQKYTVNWVYCGTFESFRNKYRTDSSRKCKFCYITTSEFEEKALEKLEDLNKGKLKPEKIDCYYDRKKLLNLLKEYKCQREIGIIKEYF